MARLVKRVLLIGWDGADWKMIEPLLEKGQMPNLERLINGGVMGNIASLTPMLSPILWNSIATGKHADKCDGVLRAEPIRHEWREFISGRKRMGLSLWAVLMFNAWHSRWVARR